MKKNISTISEKIYVAKNIDIIKFIIASYMWIFIIIAIREKTEVPMALVVVIITIFVIPGMCFVFGINILFSHNNPAAMNLIKESVFRGMPFLMLSVIVHLVVITVTLYEPFIVSTVGVLVLFIGFWLCKIMIEVSELRAKYDEAALKEINIRNKKTIIVAFVLAIIVAVGINVVVHFNLFPPSIS